MFDWIINIFKICYKSDNDSKKNFIYFNEDENEQYLINNNSYNITKI